MLRTAQLSCTGMVCSILRQPGPVTVKSPEIRVFHILAKGRVKAKQVRGRAGQGKGGGEGTHGCSNSVFLCQVGGIQLPSFDIRRQVAAGQMYPWGAVGSRWTTRRAEGDVRETLGAWSKPM